MKATIVVLGLLAIGAAMGACGGSSSKTSTTPAATAAAPTSSSATKASGGATAAAPTSTAAAASSGGGACKYMSDADAATLLPSAGQATVKSADTPAAHLTTCRWGTGPGFTNAVVIVVTELKIDAALAAAKESIDSSIEEKIDGLGDSGGFSAKAGADGIGVAFIKGKTTVLLSVGTPGANADAVAAVAKKIAAKL